MPSSVPSHSPSVLAHGDELPAVPGDRVDAGRVRITELEPFPGHAVRREPGRRVHVGSRGVADGNDPRATGGDVEHADLRAARRNEHVRVEGFGRRQPLPRLPVGRCPDHELARIIQARRVPRPRTPGRPRSRPRSARPGDPRRSPCSPGPRPRRATARRREPKESSSPGLASGEAAWLGTGSTMPRSSSSMRRSSSAPAASEPRSRSPSRAATTSSRTGLRTAWRVQGGGEDLGPAALREGDRRQVRERHGIAPQRVRRPVAGRAAREVLLEAAALGGREREVDRDGGELEERVVRLHRAASGDSRRPRTRRRVRQSRVRVAASLRPIAAAISAPLKPSLARRSAARAPGSRSASTPRRAARPSRGGSRPRARSRWAACPAACPAGRSPGTRPRRAGRGWSRGWRRRGTARPARCRGPGPPGPRWSGAGTPPGGGPRPPRGRGSCGPGTRRAPRGGRSTRRRPPRPPSRRDARSRCRPPRSETSPVPRR